MNFLIITFIVLAITIIGFFLFFANDCFDDLDPAMFWHDNYKVIQCPHKDQKTDVVINSCVTCETIHTVCDDCGEVLNVKTDCT